MYGLLNLYKQLLDLQVQMDEAAKPKVFFIIFTKFDSENSFFFKVAFGIALTAKDKHSLTPCIWKRALGRSC